MTQVVPNVKRAIRNALEMRRTHERWRDYLARWPVSQDALDQVGDTEHHERLIAEYDEILACLETIDGN